jgi:phosphoglycerate kinase
MLDNFMSEGVGGRTVLVRSDLNVPLDHADGVVRVTDDGRISASVPTLPALADAGARVIVVAHLVRPGGEPDGKYSLGPVAERLGELLGELLGAPVRLARLVDGPPELADGEVALVQNIRFDAREISKDDAERGALAGELVALFGSGGAFVSDGFGMVHRKQASVYEVAAKLPAYTGGLVSDEVRVLRRRTEDPVRPCVVVLGGSKVSDGLRQARRDRGAVAAGGLAAGRGRDVLHVPGRAGALGRQVDAGLRAGGQLPPAVGLGRIVLPTDVVVADEFSADATVRTVGADEIPDGWLGLDIGPDSVGVIRRGAGPRADGVL